MSRGKAELLNSLKGAVAERKAMNQKQRFALSYLKRWERGLGADADFENLGWFKRFFDMFSSKHDNDELTCKSEIERLFEDCSLDTSDPADHQLLLAAIARTIYPQPAGAKQKWDDAYYDRLWRDILQIEEMSEKPLSNAEIARTLIGSKKFNANYVGIKHLAEEKLSPGSVGKRVGEAKDSDKNPNLRLFDFDYIVRSELGDGPTCAAGLSFQPALPRGSAAAARAYELEEKLFADAKALFDALGIFMTQHSIFGCRRAARRLARQIVRAGLEKRPIEDRL